MSIVVIKTNTSKIWLIFISRHTHFALKMLGRYGLANLSEMENKFELPGRPINALAVSSVR